MYWSLHKSDMIFNSVRELAEYSALTKYKKETSMTSNKTKLSLTDMTPVQFRDWLLLIVNESLFVGRDKLAALTGREC